MVTEKLIVKNFGPIREAELDLRKVTVLIGEQASGKSVLAKLVTICRSVGIIGSGPEPYSDETLFDDFVNEFLGEYGIHNFREEKSFIYYTNANYQITIDFSKPLISRHFFDKSLEYTLEQSLWLEVDYTTIQEAEKKAFKLGQFELANEKKNAGKILNERLAKVNIDLDKKIEHVLYIPTDRIVCSATSEFKSKLPYLTFFNQEFLEKKSFKDRFSLFPLDVDFFYDKDKEDNLVRLKNGSTVSLQFAASGIQALAPLQVFVETANPILKHLFIIEEPELNLYPATQKKTSRIPN